MKKKINSKNVIYNVIIIILYLFFNSCFLYEAKLKGKCDLRLSYKKENTAIVDIQNISLSLELFKLDTGKYPLAHEGLKALIVKPPDIDQNAWKGPYFDSEEFTDPWGNEYIYRFPGLYNKDKFDLYSPGKDGITKSNGNDEDDINNWSEYKHTNEYDLFKIFVFILIIIYFIIL